MPQNNPNPPRILWCFAAAINEYLCICTFQKFFKNKKIRNATTNIYVCQIYSK